MNFYPLAVSHAISIPKGRYATWIHAKGQDAFVTGLACSMPTRDRNQAIRNGRAMLAAMEPPHTCSSETTPDGNGAYRTTCGTTLA